MTYVMTFGLLWQQPIRYLKVRLDGYDIKGARMYTLQHSELSGFDLEEDARSEEAPRGLADSKLI